MANYGFDADSLITQFSEASSRQGEALRKAVQEATLKALQAKKAGYVDGAGQEHPPAPDHGVRIKAADQFYRLYDVYPDRQRDSGDPSRPVNVQIVLTSNGHHAGAPLSTHGVRLHLSDGDGAGA